MLDFNTVLQMQAKSIYPIHLLINFVFSASNTKDFLAWFWSWGLWGFLSVMYSFTIPTAIFFTTPVWNTWRHLLSIHFNVRMVVFLFYFTLLLRGLLEKKLRVRDNCTVHNLFRSKEEGVQHSSIHKRTCTLRTCF